ncbi:hypothetical protein ElyMa_004523900 [Elysia marginata]|uniref:Uncharacterized protein n=1 Tax=Elysia marginata TaxID=1093978 RepID=A0AAV4HQC6_9GAST|nr:hypothetical protein ElyMa_004523900 [Elysia marginata]
MSACAGYLSKALLVVSKPFSLCLRNNKGQLEKSFLAAQKVPLIDEDHSVVYLDSTPDDASETINEIEWTRQTLSGIAADKWLDVATKKKIVGYMQTRINTISQQNALDAINITTGRIAEDLEYQVSQGMKKKRLQRILEKFDRVSSAVAATVTDDENCDDCDKILNEEYEYDGIVDDDDDDDEEEEDDLLQLFSPPTHAVVETQPQASRRQFYQRDCDKKPTLMITE